MFFSQSQDKPFCSFDLPFVSTTKTQNHQHMRDEMSDLLSPGKRPAIFSKRWIARRRLRRWPLVTKLLLWMTEVRGGGEKKNENSSLLSHQSFVLKKGIGTFLLWWCRGDTVSVQWDGFHFLDSHWWKCPNRRQLGFLLTSGLILCCICQLTFPKTILLACH